VSVICTGSAYHVGPRTQHCNHQVWSLLQVVFLEGVLLPKKVRATAHPATLLWTVACPTPTRGAASHAMRRESRQVSSDTSCRYVCM
jgi:hypothetical protein